MKRLISISMFASLALAGCGGDKWDDAVSGMKSYADKMCACEKDKDPKACAEKVHADKDKWEEGLRDKLKDSKPSESQAKAGKVADEKYDECRDKIEFGGE